ncbi:alpha/beta hydrolase family protein [Nocardia caishijiensis]|uniref:Alpha/beta hydrolase family protein n=1 Tax=Nocardia caishijiensis TaxID=184756 RepID=A0ABQ6YMK4_9NOCA|nr:alpha/beta hydrolase family protein [Nocardia caishijiensis]
MRPPRENVALILIHGFVSSSATWNSLSEKIAADPVLSVGFDIIPMDYDSPKIRLNPLRAIPDYNVIADSLMTLIEVEAAGYESVVIVSHSQGGLIVQRYLSRMSNAGRAHELDRIKSIVMLACPNSGSEIALVLRKMARFWRNPQERQLRPLDEAVSDAQRTVLEHIIYARSVTAQSCPIPIHLYAGTSDNVVVPASARGPFPAVKALPGDHFSILKESRTFSTLRHHLLEIADSASVRGVKGDVDIDVRKVEVEAQRTDRTGLLHNLSTRSVEFFDRIDELQRTIDGLLSPNKLVCISGMGGMGKTALANVAAWRMIERESDGVPFNSIVWCNRPQTIPVVALVDVIAEVSGHEYLRSLRPEVMGERIVDYLNATPTLVVLDDFDHLQMKSLHSMIDRIDARKSKFLVTSRHRLDGDSWSVELGGLDEDGSAALLFDEVRRRGLVSLDGADPQADHHVIECLAATGGWPLAIKLAIGQARLSAEGLPSVVHRLHNAAMGEEFAEILDMAWASLGEMGLHARDIVLAMALHPGAVSRVAIRRIVDVDSESFALLASKITQTSLVEIIVSNHNRDGRLRLHSLTRAHVLRKLDGMPGKRASLEARIIDYYLGYADHNADVYLDAERVLRLDEERENILYFARVAAEHALDSGEPKKHERVISFSKSMTSYLWGRGYWHERIELCNLALESADAIGSFNDSAEQYALIGRVHTWRGDFTEAHAALRSVEEHMRRGDSDNTRERMFERLKGQLACRENDHVAARTLFRRVLGSAPATADDDGRAATLVELGCCEMHLGNNASAVELLSEALELDNLLDAPEGAAISLCYLASALLAEGDERAAEKKFREALVLATRVQRLSTVARCQLGLATIADNAGDFTASARHASSAREAFAKLGMATMVRAAQALTDRAAEFLIDGEVS